MTTQLPIQTALDASNQIEARQGIDSAPTIDEILALETRLLAAQLASDVAELNALLADDLVFVTHAGSIATKTMDLDAHRTGVLKLARSEVLEREIRRLDGAAVVVTLISLAGIAGGQNFEGEFRYLRVWKHGACGWQVVAGAMNARF